MRRSIALALLLASAPLFLLVACGPGRLPEQIAITLTSDGESRGLVILPDQTVRDVLAANHITLGELDRVRPPEVTLLQNGMAITVTRVTQTEGIVTQTLPFETETQQVTWIPVGQKRIQQAGSNGTVTITYRITLEDGKPVSQVELKRDTNEPAKEIVLVGIQGAFDAETFSGTIVYLSNNNAFVMRDVAGNKRPLTTPGDLDGRAFALSPDGRWLLYTRAITTALNALWLVDTTLAKPEAKSLGVNGVLWAGFSPDGKSIAYTRADPSPGPPGWRAHNDLSIALFNNGQLSQRREVVPQSSGAKYGWWGTTYAWSPDGKRIAYANTESIGVISTTARLTKTIVLTDFAAFNTRSTWAWTPTPGWSPDGRFIVAVVHAPSPAGESDEDSPAFDVTALASNDSLQVRLAKGAGMWAAPHWTPGNLASSKIIFGAAETPYDSEAGFYRLYTADRDGSNRTLLFPSAESVGLDGLPDYDLAPDGRSLVVVYQDDLYIVDMVTSSARRLTAEGTISQPRWAR